MLFHAGASEASELPSLWLRLRLMLCPPGHEAAFAAKLPVPTAQKKLVAETVKQVLVEVVDFIDVGRSVSSQLDPLLGDGGRLAAPSEPDEDNTNPPSVSAKSLYKSTVVDSSGTNAYMLSAWRPGLGAIVELTDVPVHRGVLLPEPGNLKVLDQGTTPTKPQLIARLQAAAAAAPTN